MSQILFKSKGVRSSYKKIMLFCDILLLILGIAGIFFSQMKHSTLTVSFSTSSGQSLGSGNFGGGYLLKEDARNTILTISVIFIILAVSFIESIIISDKSYINVFDDHIEAMQYAAFFAIIKRPVNLTYDKINDIQYLKPENAFNTDKIVLYTTLGKYVIVVKDTEEAYRIIKGKIQGG